MAELKTKPTDQNVADFISTIEDEQRRADCKAILELMKEVMQLEPKMWGSSMVGFGDYHYKYESGHEGDTFIVGFSPRKQNLTLYLTGGLLQQEDLLAQLGKHKTGKGCLYINKLAQINIEILRAIIQRSAEAFKEK